MKKLTNIICIFLLYGCVFTYDPARGLLNVHNNSNEAVYVYLKYGTADSLPLISNINLFTFLDANSKDAYTIGGKRKKPRLPGNENELTLFFISEKMMRINDLEEIHRNQIFAKKITLTKEELKKRNWIVTYP